MCVCVFFSIQQQHGFLHAGVSMTLADHTAGMCASTMLPEHKAVLTSSANFNLVAPGQGQRIVCKATIVKAGKTLIVVDSGLVNCCSRVFGFLSFFNVLCDHVLT